MVAGRSARTGAAAEQKSCRDCHALMPRAAKKCPTCGSYQNWERYLGFGASVLALPVALISVLSITVPAGIKTLRAGTAEPSVYLLATDGGVISLAIENRGTGPMLVEQVDLLPTSFGVEPRSFPLLPDNTAAAARLVRAGDISVLSLRPAPDKLDAAGRGVLAQLTGRPAHSIKDEYLTGEIVKCEVAVRSRSLQETEKVFLLKLPNCRSLLVQLYGSVLPAATRPRPAGSASPP